MLTLAEDFNEITLSMIFAEIPEIHQFNDFLIFTSKMTIEA